MTVLRRGRRGCRQKCLWLSNVNVNGIYGVMLLFSNLTLLQYVMYK